MGAKPVAFQVQGIPSVEKHPADINKTGNWILAGGPITVPSVFTKSEKGPLLFEATQVFNYVAGMMPGPAGAPVPIPPPLPDTVMLKAKPTMLTEGKKPVLVSGDTMKSPFGNELKVTVCSAKLATA